MKILLTSTLLVASLAFFSNCTSMDSNPTQSDSTVRAAQPGNPNYQQGTSPVMQNDNPHKGEMRSIKAGPGGSAFVGY